MFTTWELRAPVSCRTHTLVNLCLQGPDRQEMLGRHQRCHNCLSGTQEILQAAGPRGFQSYKGLQNSLVPPN